MDYVSYRQFRDSVLHESPGETLLRLDCMNPVKALAPLFEAQLHSPGQGEAVEVWCRVTGMHLDRERTVSGQGVRDLLAGIFLWVQRSGLSLWLPNDVYPVYWQLAEVARLAAESFSTLPSPSMPWRETGSRVAVLLPIPFSPLGRLPAPEEQDEIIGWLAGSKERLLIVDAAYTYNFVPLVGFLTRILSACPDQCAALFSCSKSWLLPQVIGIGVMSPEMRRVVETHSSRPDTTSLSGVVGALQARPTLPLLQQEVFDREWRRIAPRLRAAEPGWEAPVSGYFSVVRAPFRALLREHQMLAVPASVFGSNQTDLSIATCLHDLAAHEKREWPGRSTRAV